MKNIKADTSKISLLHKKASSLPLMIKSTPDSLSYKLLQPNLFYDIFHLLFGPVI